MPDLDPIEDAEYIGETREGTVNEPLVGLPSRLIP